MLLLRVFSSSSLDGSSAAALVVVSFKLQERIELREFFFSSLLAIHLNCGYVFLFSIRERFFFGVFFFLRRGWLGWMLLNWLNSHKRMRFLPHRPIKGAVWGVQQLSARASLTVSPPSTSPPTLSMGFREFRDLLFCGMCIYDLYWIFLLLRLLLLLSFFFFHVQSLLTVPSVCG